MLNKKTDFRIKMAEILKIKKKSPVPMKLPCSAYEILTSIQTEKQTKPIYLCYITFLQSKLGTKNELQT